jgi:hypothetical protein
MNKGLNAGEWRTGLAALVLAVGGMTGVTEPAAAGPPDESRTIEVTSTFTEPPPNPDGVRCVGLHAPPPGCGLVERTTTTFAGTLAGVAGAEVRGAMGTDGKYHFDGTWQLADAVVDGCGTGGLVIEMYEGTVEAAPDQPGVFVGATRWRIRPGSGTVGLAGITGGDGTATFDFTGEPSGDEFVQGDFSGTTTCADGRRATPSPANTRRITIRVRAEYTEPLSQIFGVECRGLASGEPRCVGLFGGPATFTGTIQGVTYYDGSGPTADGHMYEGPDIFEDAVIEGCGRGGFSLDTFGGEMFVDAHPEDGSTGGFNGWRLRPGSGTGGLSGLASGEGENHWHQYWSESGTETWGRGLYTGTITCDVPMTDASGAGGPARGDGASKGTGGQPADRPVVLASLEASDDDRVLPVTGLADRIATPALALAGLGLALAWLRRAGAHAVPAGGGR